MDSKKEYFPPMCEDLGRIQNLCLLASLSLEGDFDETLNDGGDAEYVGLDTSQFQ